MSDIKDNIKPLEEFKKLAVEMVKAWESLKEGHYNPNIIETWLIEDMAPIINKLRAFIKLNDIGNDR